MSSEFLNDLEKQHVKKKKTKKVKKMKKSKKTKKTISDDIDAIFKRNTYKLMKRFGLKYPIQVYRLLVNREAEKDGL